MTRRMAVAIRSLPIIFAFFAVNSNLLAASSEVIITHASMSTTAIPLWVAQRLDLFGKYGVKSKVVWVRSNPAQIATLASGDTQIAYGGATTALAAAVGGKELKIIASLSSRENLDLVARPGINSPKELRAKRFGIQSIGGGVWKTATVWLEHFGMEEKRDNIQMIVIGDVTVLSQALETGRIDATVVPGFLSRRLAEKGFAVLGRCDQVRLPSVGMAVVVDKAYLQQSSDTLQDVVKAITEGMGEHEHAPVPLRAQLPAQLILEPRVGQQSRWVEVEHLAVLHLGQARARDVPHRTPRDRVELERRGMPRR